MFNNYYVKGDTSNHLHVDTEKIEKGINSVNNTLKKLVDVSKDGFVKVQDQQFRLSAITSVSTITENAFIICVGDSQYLIKDEDDLKLYNAYNKLAGVLKLSFDLKDDMAVCVDCGDTFIMGEKGMVPIGRLHLFQYCPSCRKSHMHIIGGTRDFSSMDLLFKWEDHQIDRISSFDENFNVYENLMRSFDES